MSESQVFQMPRNVPRAQMPCSQAAAGHCPRELREEEGEGPLAVTAHWVGMRRLGRRKDRLGRGGHHRAQRAGLQGWVRPKREGETGRRTQVQDRGGDLRLASSELDLCSPVGPQRPARLSCSALRVQLPCCRALPSLQLLPNTFSRGSSCDLPLPESSCL